jgi:anti-anti-sigma factor
MAVVPEHGLSPRGEHRHSDAPVAFRCDVLYVGDHAVVVARGEVDLATAPALIRKVSATLALPVTGITVDLAYVTFLDSSGVNALITMRNQAVERHIEFRLESVPRQARQVLEMCKLLEHFGITARSDASVPPPDVT